MKRLLLCVLLAVGVSGCGGGGKQDNTYRIAVIPKGLTHEHWKSVERGAKQAAADLSRSVKPVEIIWDGPRKESDASEQLNLIDQKVAMGVHGLVLAPQHSKQMVAPVRRAVENNVPVVIFDSDLDDRELYVKYVATDNENGGALAAKYLLRCLDRKGVQEPNLVLFRYQLGSESTEQREKGFLAELERARAKGRKINLISDDQYAGATIDTARDKASPLLVSLRERNVDGIFAVNESATTGMLLALNGVEEVKKRALLMGFDSSGQLRDALASGDVVGLVVQNPFRMGYLGVWNLVQHLEGYNVSPAGKSLSTGEVILTANRDDVDGKGILHLKDEAALQLYDPEKQLQQKIDLPTYSKR